MKLPRCGHCGLREDPCVCVRQRGVPGHATKWWRVSGFNVPSLEYVFVVRSSTASVWLWQSEDCPRRKSTGFEAYYQSRLQAEGVVVSRLSARLKSAEREANKLRGALDDIGAATYEAVVPQRPSGEDAAPSSSPREER